MAKLQNVENGKNEEENGIYEEEREQESEVRTFYCLNVSLIVRLAQLLSHMF